MTKNLRGGKSHKKFKKVVQDKENPAGALFQRNKEEGQDYGRVLRLLGDRRVACFCNDAKERICKIRGAMCKGPKKQKLEIGDIVIISFRDFEESNSVGDIIGKIHRDHWNSIRKEEGIHRDLLLQGGAAATAGIALEDLFNYGTEEVKPQVESESESDLDSDDIDHI